MPFIATLAMMVAARGLAAQISGKQTQVSGNTVINGIASSDLLGIPLLVYILRPRDLSRTRPLQLRHASARVLPLLVRFDRLRSRRACAWRVGGRYADVSLQQPSRGQARYTYRFESDRLHHLRLENSFDGGQKWTTFLEAVYRRVSAEGSAGAGALKPNTSLRRRQLWRHANGSNANRLPSTTAAVPMRFSVCRPAG